MVIALVGAIIQVHYCQRSLTSPDHRTKRLYATQYLSLLPSKTIVNCSLSTTVPLPTGEIAKDIRIVKGVRIHASGEKSLGVEVRVWG